MSIVHKIKTLLEAEKVNINAFSKALGISPKGVYKWDDKSIKVCKIPTVSGVENLKREDYTVLSETQTKAEVHRFWILFIPIVRIGPKTDEARETKAFDKMIKTNKADGVLAAKYTHKNWCVPLLLFNYSHRSVILKGKPFVLKTNATRNDTIK